MSKTNSLKFPDLGGSGATQSVPKRLDAQKLPSITSDKLPNRSEAVIPRQSSQSTEVADTTKPLRVIFCLPGRSYSREFLLCWSNLIFECIKRGITPMISQQYSSMVAFARTLCLGADVRRGENQKPFDGKIAYDYICWIDSDVIFSVEAFFSLLASKYSVTSGMYITENCENFPIVTEWDTDYFLKHGTFHFLTSKDIDDVEKIDNKYFPVSYVGMGFMLIKSGVIETLKYPWFSSDLEHIGDLVDLSSEDVTFCRKLTSAGYQIMVDSTIRVGHQKLFVV